jgi:hypothetical protein
MQNMPGKTPSWPHTSNLVSVALEGNGISIGVKPRALETDAQILFAT